MPVLRTAFCLGLSVTLGAAAGSAAAQAYPNKPIRMLAPEAGGANEVAGRIIARAMAESMGQQFVIENRGAASGVIAGEITAHAPADGYTLLYYGSTIWLLPFLRDNVPFDPVKDLAPVSFANTAPFFIFMNPSVPANNLRELIALAKAKPGQLNYGSAGSGAATHLAAEMFKMVAGVDITRIAYKGSSLAATGLLAGEVQLTFVSASGGLQYVKTGRLKALAVASTHPSPLAPDVPTTAAAGLPNYLAASTAGMFTTAKTPRAIVQKLNREVVQALARPDVKEAFDRVAIEAVGSSPEEFAAFIKADMAKWSKVIKQAGIHE